MPGPIMGRHRFGPVGLLIGGLLVATFISSRLMVATPTSRSGGAFLGVGTLQLALIALAAGGVLYLALSRFTEPTSSAVKTSDTNGEEAALEALKKRYVAGEIDQVEYELRLETLFETETVADAKRRVETKSASDEETPERDVTPRSDEVGRKRVETPRKRRRANSHRGHCK